jgi:anti-sigma-K factor RskA
VTTEHVTDLLPLYALGALEAGEQARLEAHLAQCPACRTEAAELLAVTSSLAAAVPARHPPPGLRAAVLQRISETPRARVVPAAAARSRPPATRAAMRRPAMNWGMAAVVAALAGLLAWNAYLTNRINSLQAQYRQQAAAMALISSPLTESMALHGQGQWMTASGRAYVDPTSRNVVLIVEHLAPLPEGQTYQAWIITDAGPESAGLVNVSRSGWGMSWLSTTYPDKAVIGVSVEPAGGSEWPSEVVLLEEQGG